MTIAVGLGLMTQPFSTPAAFWRFIDLCEAGGVDSYWQSDRIVSTEPVLECMSSLAAVAGRTRRLQFGMNVVSLAFRDPVLLAKECATIDYLSEGRMLPAFGIGTPHSPDWRALDRPTRGRGRRTDEALDIIAALWRGETVDHSSEFFTVRGARISPLPLRPRLPLWIGGSSDAAIRRTARIGTGWMGGRETPEQARRVIEGVNALAPEYGRRVPDDHFGVGFFYRFGREDDPAAEGHRQAMRRRFPDRDPSQGLVVGDASDLLAQLRRYVAVGVTKFVLRPVGTDDDDLMEQTRRLIEELLPESDGLNAG